MAKSKKEVEVIVGRVTAMLTARGESWASLGRALNVRTTAIYKRVKGQNGFYGHEIPVIAKFLDCQVEDILGLPVKSKFDTIKARATLRKVRKALEGMDGLAEQIESVMKAMPGR